MGYYRQFDKFDPLTGSVPNSPFSSLPDIAVRSRKLLKDRSRDEIDAAACFIDWATDEFIKEEIESGIADLRELRIDREESIRDLEQQCNKDEYIDPIDFPEIMSDEDLRSSFDDKQVWAFKECYGWYLPLDEPDFKEGKDYECFAVLALWLIADSIEAGEYTGLDVVKNAKKIFPDMEISPEMEQIYKKGFPVTNELRTIAAASGFGELPEYLCGPETISLTSSGRYAIDAMEAVCFAEHLYDVTLIKDSYEKKTEESVNQIKSDHRTKLEEELKRFASEKGRKAANMRHTRTTHKIKQFAIDLYLKERDVFKSVREAARTIEDDVVKHAKDLGASTLSGVSAFDQIYTWLREAAKK